MPELEMFFDYACVYCLRGYEHLMTLLPKYPQLEIAWRVCEAHPRPDRHGLHSDLCARGMYFALESGADLAKYHARMYHAAIIERANIEDVRVVAKLADGLLCPDALYDALSKGAYVDRLLHNNRLAWDVYRFAAVPSFRMGGELLICAENVGVSPRQLSDFIERHL